MQIGIHNPAKLALGLIGTAATAVVVAQRDPISQLISAHLPETAIAVTGAALVAFAALAGFIAIVTGFFGSGGRTVSGYWFLLNAIAVPVVGTLVLASTGNLATGALVALMLIPSLRLLRTGVYREQSPFGYK